MTPRRMGMAWIVLVVSLAGCPAVALASGRPEAAPSVPSPGQLATRQLDQTDAQDLRQVMDRVDRELSPYAPLPGWQDIRAYVGGHGLRLDVRGLLLGMTRFFGAEVIRSFGTLGQVIVLAVLGALLAQLRLGGPDSPVGRVAEAVVLLVLAGVALEAFYLAMRVAAGSVGELRDILLASLPLLVSLLAGSGALLSAGLLHPLVLFFADAIAFLAADVAFPLLFFGAVLDLVSIFAAPYSVTGLARLMRLTALGTLALAMTAFLGLVAVEGVAGAVADGVGLRAAKFAAATFVPVIGRTFADAMELVASASMLVRSGVGITALLLVFVAVAFPLLKLVSMVFAFRLGGALVQPLGVGGAAQALGAMGDALATMALVVGAVAMMCFLALSAMLAAGVGVTMLR